MTLEITVNYDGNETLTINYDRAIGPYKGAALVSSGGYSEKKSLDSLAGDVVRQIVLAGTYEDIKLKFNENVPVMLKDKLIEEFDKIGYPLKHDVSVGTPILSADVSTINSYCILFKSHGIHI